MNAKKHPVYIDLKRTTLNTRGLRQLRRKLRWLDKRILKACKANNLEANSVDRVRMAHEIILQNEEWRHETLRIRQIRKVKLGAGLLHIEGSDKPPIKLRNFSVEIIDHKQ